MMLNNLDQKNADETRVIYHIDDEETPYLVKLNVPPSQVTLGDFKNVLNLPRNGYKFFFKSMDDDFGVVKEEIIEENMKLPIFKGRVVSWLVSADESNLSSTGSGSQLTEVSASRSASLARRSLHKPVGGRLNDDQRNQTNLIGLGTYDYSCSESVLSDDFDTGTEFESTIGSQAVPFHMRNKKRNNCHQHYHNCHCDTSSMMTSDVETTTFVDSEDDDYQTHNEDDYEDLDDDLDDDRLTQISSTTDETSVSKAAENREKRNRMLLQARLRHKNSSASKNKSSDLHSKFRKLPYSRLQKEQQGLSRSSSMTSITDSTMSLNIITVTLHLTSVNFLGISIVGQSYKNGDGGIYVGSIMSGGAVAADGRIDPGDMILQVNDVNFENLSNDKAVEVLREAVSKPGPIKLVIAKCCFPQASGQSNNGSIQTAPMSNADIFALKKDEPVRPIDPRAWIEHTKIAQGLADAEYPPRPESVSTIGSYASTVKEMNYNNLQLTTDMDMLFIARAMAVPESELEVKDRMWLKITIPNAFLGSEVVDWLYNHVHGFSDRKEAKKYASSMLKQNYIKHTVNKSSFSEQCYYTFGDLIALTNCVENLSLNDSKQMQSNATQFAPWPDTVHYGVFGAAPGTSIDNSGRFEHQSMRSGNGNAADPQLNQSNGFIQIGLPHSTPVVSTKNHLLPQHLLMQSQFSNQFNNAQTIGAGVLYPTEANYRTNGGSSNSSETQSSLNTQSTRDTAIGVCNSNKVGGVRDAILSHVNHKSNGISNNFDQAGNQMHSEKNGHENEVNNDDERLLYN